MFSIAAKTGAALNSRSAASGKPRIACSRRCRPSPIYNPGITHLSYIRSSFQSRKQNSPRGWEHGNTLCSTRHKRHPSTQTYTVSVSYDINLVPFFLPPPLLRIPWHDSALFAIYNPTTKGEWVRTSFRKLPMNAS